MMPSLSDLIAMVGRTLVSPREGAEEILALGVPRAALGIIVALVVILSVIMALVTKILAQAVLGISVGGLLGSPLVAGAVQGGVLLILIAAVHWIGRAMGGTGRLADAVLLMSWQQFVMVCLQVFQTTALLVLPPLAGLVGIAAVVLMFWMLTNFIAVLHGFRSLGQVFVMILVSAFGIAFVLTIVLRILGLGIVIPEGAI